MSDIGLKCKVFWDLCGLEMPTININISHLLLVLCAVRDFIHELKSMNCAFENPKYSMICISLAHQIHIMS